MKTLLNNNDLIEALNYTQNLGFVPTMGCLHNGHISLIKKSQRVCNRTIVSIFINPTQFNNKNDYKNYPRNIKKDLSILRKLKVDYVYLPKKKDIYDSNNKFKFKLDKKDKILCAKHRKGHFEGVINIMNRLTEKINPHRVFMGEKDFQQLYLVKKYLKKYKHRIISCKTIREKNFVALSSRNLNLKNKEFNKAGLIAKNLFYFKKSLSHENNLDKLLKEKKIQLTKIHNIKIDYLELRNLNNLKKSNKINNSKLFIAYYLKKIRLIDNF